MKALGVAAILVAFACGSKGPAPSPGPTSIVVVDVLGPGRVLSIPPGIDCPGECAGRFPLGSTVTFAAAPADDGAFTEWSGDCTGATGCELSVAGTVAVVAHFETSSRHASP
jgi:hypothetical protein